MCSWPLGPLTAARELITSHHLRLEPGQGHSAFFRGPKDHKNLRILRSGCKTQDKEHSRDYSLGSLCLAPIVALHFGGPQTPVLGCSSL